MTDIGHNGVNADHLKALIERIEKIGTQIEDLKSDEKDVYSEVKSHGYDVSIVRKVVAMRKKDQDKVLREHEMLSLYLSAIGSQLSLSFDSAGPV